MAWFGEGLPSLSNLKGQITNFTKEVLSDSLVESTDEPSEQLKQVNEKCMELQKLLNSRDAEIEYLRRQNSELQKTVVDLDAKSNQSFQNESTCNEDGELFWDLPLSKNRDTEVQNQLRSLQDQLAQATMKIHELEIERKRLQKANDANTKEEVIENHQKAELLRAKQDMMNRIIQIGEKGREAERNVKRLQMDESTLVNDFRMAISKLSSSVQLDLIKNALLALDSDNDRSNKSLRKLSSDGFETVSLKNSQKKQDSQEAERIASNREVQLLQKIDELQEENKHLQSNIDELDQQHSASLEKLLSLKEELQKKHSTLQNAYEKLYVEHNEALEKLAVPRISTESQTSHLNVEKLVQTEPTTELTVKNLNSKIEKLLKNTPLDRESDEDLVECLTRNYVESRWKQETLERRVTELNRELKQTSELKEAMQMECDDMQGNIESLLMEIQHLKSNLPAIPEASEERVASLETETESLQEELSKLQLENDCLKQLNSTVSKQLRSQESVEAEVKNVKEQLELAQQQLTGKNEDEKGLAEILSEKLNKALEDNNELRRRVDNLVVMEKQMKEQLNMSLEKCKSLDENMELTEELKLDLQNVRCELVSSKENNKRLDASLQAVMEAKTEAERDNEILCKEKDRLEHELEMLKAGNRMDDHMVEILREQLQGAIQDKNDLEYDLLNVRKELDSALTMMEIKSGQLEKLGKENEKLAKENRDLVEQVAANDNESLDRIELLNTEKILLEQEYEAFKLEIASDKTKLAEMEAKIKQLSTQLEEQEMKKGETDRQLEELVLVQQKLAEVETRYQALKSEATNSEELSTLQQKLNEYEKLVDSLRSDLANQKIENERLAVELRTASEKHLEASQMARETIESLSQLVRNKDDEMKKFSNELGSLQAEKEELVKLVQAKHNESLQYHAEIQRLTQVLSEQSSVVERLMNEKTKTESDNADGDTRCKLEEHVQLVAQINSEKERCSAFEAALIQEQANNRILQDQLNDSRNKEANTIRELERLRAHLIEVEENYTQETVQAEAKLKDLESQLQQAEELAKNSSTNYTSASIRANQQVESLQQQMALIIQQRDEIQAKLSAAEDRALACSASVTNLQSVLEDFQRDKEKDIAAATEKIRNQLQNSFDKQKELMNEISNLKDQLLEAKQCLQAASRLTEQLDQKNEKIGLLEEEVARLTELVNTTDERIQAATESVKGKVDKTLVKNLLLGFLSSSASDKSSVMRVFATVLDFDESERDKVGLNNTTAKNSWFSNLLSYNGPPSKDDEASLSAAFIKFLEQESNPKPQLPALPISNAPIPKPSHSRQPSSSSTQSTLLLSNISLPTFPDFVPARNTGSILKEVLKDS